LRPACTEF